MAGLAVYEMAPPEDRVEELLECVAKATKSTTAELLETFKSKADAEDFAGIVRDVIENYQQAFKSGSEDDIEGLFALVLSFLKNFPKAELGSVVERLAAVVTSAANAGEAKANSARLRVLGNLYNLLSDATNKAEKLVLLSSIIRFASETSQLELLAPVFAGAASWKAKWGLTDQQARSLYLLIANALGKAGGAHMEQAQVFLIRYLTTFEADVAAIDDEALAHARDAAVRYVNAPAVSQRSALPQLAVVKALAKDARYASLHALLTIFAGGSLEEYTTFVASHAELTASLRGFDAKEAVRTMRQLTLVSLASAKPVLEIAAVAAALQIPAEDVESQVVQAVTSGLIEARVDQAAGTVTVTRSVTREFGAAQWAGLQAKLRAWRDNVTTLMATVEGGPTGGRGGQ